MLWKEKYKIGVDLIDQQHQELFRRVTDFIVTVRGQGDWEERLAKVKETLAFMQEYVVTHFADEEAYQAGINYPGLAAHQQIHDNFKREIDEYAKKFAATGFDEDLVQSFGGKLMAWLINHVAREDQRIGKFVRQEVR
ncbi:MAG TPA: hemerythrin family protein [Firmicutes bacterium]|nr:hemerythrin family protein [Bacillota bacterium]